MPTATDDRQILIRKADALDQHNIAKNKIFEHTLIHFITVVMIRRTAIGK